MATGMANAPPEAMERQRAPQAHPQAGLRGDLGRFQTVEVGQLILSATYFQMMLACFFPMASWNPQAEGKLEYRKCTES